MAARVQVAFVDGTVLELQENDTAALTVERVRSDVAAEKGCTATSVKLYVMDDRSSDPAPLTALKEDGSVIRGDDETSPLQLLAVIVDVPRFAEASKAARISDDGFEVDFTWGGTVKLGNIEDANHYGIVRLTLVRNEGYSSFLGVCGPEFVLDNCPHSSELAYTFESDTCLHRGSLPLLRGAHAPFRKGDRLALEYVPYNEPLEDELCELRWWLNDDRMETLHVPAGFVLCVGSYNGGTTWRVER
eukprot:TRINITY_DN47904_c0_g1_i1.p1 TRINITY_DN47904_c0_g1~~TRINITY_DN47904_c0_g1_i1.p1  ORF type:complete len:261 (+),score=44.33 TRINITY_DN47904_c0_g1_i1:48-785(+)